MVETATIVDASATFIMHGAREVLNFSAGGVHIQQQVVTLERCVNESPGIAFDLAKSLIESVCKTILGERGHSVIGDPDLPQLIRDTCHRVPLLPDSRAGDTAPRDSLRKTINGLVTTIQGLCELRRMEGTASHGRDAYAQSLESVQARFVAQAADTVVHFLYKTHKTYPSQNSNRRLEYKDEVDFNEFIDSNNDAVTIFNLTYNPSEVLFQLDQQAYRTLLVEFQQDEESSATEDVLL